MHIWGRKSKQKPRSFKSVREIYVVYLILMSYLLLLFCHGDTDLPQAENSHLRIAEKLLYLTTPFPQISCFLTFAHIGQYNTPTMLTAFFLFPLFAHA